MLKYFYQKYNLYLFTALSSIVLSLLFIYYKQPFSVDGVLYLACANEFMQHGLKAALLLYNWPLYSILIALFTKYLHLSLVNSAYTINAILDVITVLSFIAITAELGGDRKTQLLAAVIILTFPDFCHFRFHILRGHGYYAFGLLAILLLIRYSRSYKWRYAIGWSTAAIAATLFRIEGTAFVLFLPLALLFKPGLKLTKKINLLAKSYSLQIFALALIAIFASISNVVSFGRIPELIGQLTHGLQTRLQTLQAIKTLFASNPILQLLTSTHSEFSFFMLGGIIGSLLGIIAVTLGLFYLALTIYAIKQKAIPWSWEAKAILLCAAILNIIIICLFFLQHFFLSSRYVAFLSIILLIATPFAITKIYTNRRWLFVLVLIGLIYTAFTGITHFGPSKAYIINAGDWLKNNTAKTSRICSSDTQLYYYTNRPGRVFDLQQFTANINIEQCDYLTLKIQRHGNIDVKKLLNKLKNKPIKIFHNSRGDSALVFKIQA